MGKVDVGFTWAADTGGPPAKIRRGNGCHAYPTLPRWCLWTGGGMGVSDGLLGSSDKTAAIGSAVGRLFVLAAPIGLLGAPVEMLLRFNSPSYHLRKFQ